MRLVLSIIVSVSLELLFLFLFLYHDQEIVWLLIRTALPHSNGKLNSFVHDGRNSVLASFVSTTSMLAVPVRNHWPNTPYLRSDAAAPKGVQSSLA